MTDLLFAAPWWLLGTLILTGGVVFWAGNQRSQNGPRYAGIGLILLAIGLFTLSFFVETDKEKCSRQSNELVKAVQGRDWSTFSSLMEDDVSLGTSESTIFRNRDALVAGAKADTETYNLTHVSAKVTGVEQDATGVTVDMDAWSEQSTSMGYQVPSSWKLIWEKNDKDWRLHQVLCLKIANSGTREIGQLIGK